MTPGGGLEPPVTRRDVDVGDDLRLHVAMSGDGPPLILLHGFTGSTESWTTLRPGLAAQHQVIAIDLPGHGHSSAPPDPRRYALDRFADDVASVCDALGITSAAVLGYSLGARAALAFAARHPARVSALVLVSASPGIEDDAARLERAANDDALAADIERDGIEAFIDQWERLPMWESQHTLDASARHALRAQRLENDPRGLANSLRGAGQGASPPMGGALTAIVSPVLLVAGERDAKYVALGQTLQRGLRQAEFMMIPAAGHALHVERPRELQRLVLDFLHAR